VNLQINDKIKLEITLESEKSNKYIKCILRNNGIEMIQSPITVPNISGSFYYYEHNDLRVPVDAKSISAEFIIYDDPAMTIISEEDHRTLDIFKIDPTSDTSIINDKLNQILSTVIAHDLNSGIVGFIKENEDKLIGEVYDDGIIGYIEENKAILGYVIDNEELRGNIEETDNIIGNIEGE